MGEERTRPKVVVVDDSSVVLDAVSAALGPLGWEVVCLSNDHGITERIRAEDPDLVLMDVNMPYLTGEAIMAALTAFGPKKAKLLLHSDLPTADLRALTRKTKADGFIHKTGDALALDRMMRGFLAARGDLPDIFLSAGQL